MQETEAGASPRRDSKRFDRSLRMALSAEFKQVFANPCKVNGKHLTLLVKRNGLDHPRLGMAISRKYVRTATGRNRIKRQIRESFRLHQGVIGNFDVVVMARSGSDKVNRNRLRLELDRQWQELAERCKES